MRLKTIRSINKVGTFRMMKSETTKEAGLPRFSEKLNRHKGPKT